MLPRTVWTSLHLLKVEPLTGCCEYGNELSGSVIYGVFLDHVFNCWFLKVGSTEELKNQVSKFGLHAVACQWRIERFRGS
jgi:hypothetical protein